MSCFDEGGGQYAIENTGTAGRVLVLGFKLLECRVFGTGGFGLALRYQSAGAKCCFAQCSFLETGELLDTCRVSWP